MTPTLLGALRENALLARDTALVEGGRVPSRRALGR